MAALFECSEDLGAVRKIENFIKKNKSRTLLEWLIDPHNIPTGQLAQLVRVPHVRD
jgi:putative endonuclease